MGGNPEHEPWLYENVGRASEPSDPWRDYINGMEAQSAPMRVSGGVGSVIGPGNGIVASQGTPPISYELVKRHLHLLKGMNEADIRMLLNSLRGHDSRHSAGGAKEIAFLENELATRFPMRVSGGAAVGQWPEMVPIAEGELRNLRDDKTKLETDLAYERYRVVLLQQQVEALLPAPQARQPLSVGWHSMPDIAAPEGRKPMPARALRPPKDGHPMPWLEP